MVIIPMESLVQLCPFPDAIAGERTVDVQHKDEWLPVGVGGNELDAVVCDDCWQISLLANKIAKLKAKK